MSKKLKPFLAHSELTDCIYIIDGNDKYEVTEQCIKAMKATNRMANVLDKIRAEIEMYEADCKLQGGTDECEECNSNVFGSIYRIIDKYKAESEDKE